MSLSFTEAQNLFNEERFEESYEIYKNIINNNIDQDEVWYSMYRLAQISLNKNNINESEYWVQNSFRINKNRVENLYLMCKYFRENRIYKKALIYYNLAKDIKIPSNGINVDTNVYKYFLKYEMTLLHYYISDNRKEGLKHIIEYLNLQDNNYNILHTYNNIIFYVQPISNVSESFEYKLPDLDNYYYPANPSLIILNDKKILNIRYISYKLIPPTGYYWTTESCDGNKILKTENVFYYIDDDFKISSNPHRMDKVLYDLQPINTIIYGLEDIRLIEKDNKVYYFATSNEYTPQISIIHGEYDYINQKYINNRVLKSPKNAWCEKNWIPVLIDNEINIIYSWFPLSIGKIEGNDLKIYREEKMPNFFKWIKGSSTLFEINEELWSTVHFTIDGNPRIYLHMIVVFNKNLKLLRYSLPFSFFKNSVEYNIGFMVKDCYLYFTISQFDSNPTLVKCHLSNFSFILP